MRLEKDDPRLMDYVLGELEDGEARDVAAALELDENKDAREVVDELRGVAETTRRILREEEPADALSDEQRAAIVGTAEVPEKVFAKKRPSFTVMELFSAAAILVVLVGLTALAIPKYLGKARVSTADSFAMSSPPPPPTFQVEPAQGASSVATEEEYPNSESESRYAVGTYDPQETAPSADDTPTPEALKELRVREHVKYAELYRNQGLNAEAVEIYSHVLQLDPENQAAKEGLYEASLARSAGKMDEDLRGVEQDSAKIRRLAEAGQLPAGADAKGIKQYQFRVNGSEEAPMVEARNRLEIEANLKDGLSLKYESDTPEPKPEPKPEPNASESSEIDWESLNVGNLSGQAVIGAAPATPEQFGNDALPAPAEEEWAEYNVGSLTGQTEIPDQVASNQDYQDEDNDGDGLSVWQWNTPTDKPTEIVGGPGTETYVKVAGVKPFVAVREEPLSTFSIDVDTAAYSNVRRFLNQGQLPPPDAVRIEEMINYFAYAYPQPVDGRPFAVAVHGAPAPWAPQHRLVRVGVKGKEVPQSERPAANLVFLLDVSGSMGDANKLPLVKESMKTLLSQLGPNDRVGIVTYAGNAQKVLDPTPCSESARIVQAIDSLQSGGSTNGGGGIQMAYDLAQAGFLQERINRVIIATDGDFNVGMTSHGDLMSMIEARAKSGVFLTALGFGMGNLKDSTLEQLADRGNGNYAYIDNHAEARRALVDQLSGTLQTIAKDVKIQVEFNPALVSHYRLLGYENRALANRDFNDDTKDAGEIGAGHTVTALYEIIPTGGTPATGVDPLRYQSTTPGVDALKYGDAGATAEEDSIAPEPSGEWLTVKMRYKEPQGNESTKLEVALAGMNADLRETDADFQFASAVAAFGQVLRNTGYRHATNFDRIIEMARASANGDVDREAFVDMVITAKTISATR